MNKQIELGKVWLPQEFIDMIENHRQYMLEANKDNDSYEVLLKADFSLYFSDFMMKNYSKLKGDKKNDNERI